MSPSSSTIARPARGTSTPARRIASRTRVRAGEVLPGSTRSATGKTARRPRTPGWRWGDAAQLLGLQTVPRPEGVDERDGLVHRQGSGEVERRPRRAREPEPPDVLVHDLPDLVGHEPVGSHPHPRQTAPRSTARLRCARRARRPVGPSGDRPRAGGGRPGARGRGARVRCSRGIRRRPTGAGSGPARQGVVASELCARSRRDRRRSRAEGRRAAARGVAGPADSTRLARAPRAQGEEARRGVVLDAILRMASPAALASTGTASS